MGSRSGSKRGNTYISGTYKETYTEEVNGVKVIRTRIKYKKKRKVQSK